MRTSKSSKSKSNNFPSQNRNDQDINTNDPQQIDNISQINQTYPQPSSHQKRGQIQETDNSHYNNCKDKSKRSQIELQPQPASRIKNQKQLKNYIIGKTLGQGTFGKVKLAIHQPTQEKVAIKILQKKKISEVADAQRVKRQIHILKLIHHPNLVQLYQIIQTPKQILLIMEYMENGQLFDYIVKNKRIKQSEACKLFHQIIDGVQYMHRIGIVHRDLKPENIIFDYKKQAKIVDFGLGNLYKKGQLLRTPCGSPCYAAPQMIQGQKYEGLKVDIWSCGVILFAMICGYLPFQDENVPTLYKKILSCQYQCHRSISESAKDLLSKILKIDKKQRYTIDQIRSHPWMKQNIMNGDFPRQKGVIVGFQPMPINRQILQMMKKTLTQISIDINLVQEYLQANRNNNQTTSYYLFLKKMRKQNLIQLQNQTKQNYQNVPTLEDKIKSLQKVSVNKEIKINNQKTIQNLQENNSNFILIDNYFTKTSYNNYPQYYQLTSQNQQQVKQIQNSKSVVNSKKLDYYHSKKTQKPNQKKQNNIVFEESSNLNLEEKQKKRCAKSKQKQVLRPTSSKPKPKSKGKSKDKGLLLQQKNQVKNQDLNFYKLGNSNQQNQKNAILSSISLMKLRQTRKNNQDITCISIAHNQAKKKKRSVSVSAPNGRISEKPKKDLQKSNKDEVMTTQINYARTRIPLSTKSINKVQIQLQNSDKLIQRHKMMNHYQNTDIEVDKSRGIKKQVQKTISCKLQKRRNLIELSDNARKSKDKNMDNQVSKSKDKQNRSSLNNKSINIINKNKDDSKDGLQASKSKQHKNMINSFKNNQKIQNNSLKNDSQRSRMNKSVSHALKRSQNQNTFVNLNNHNLTMAIDAINPISQDFALGFANKKRQQRFSKTKNPKKLYDAEIDRDISSQFVQQYMKRKKANKIKNKCENGSKLTNVINNQLGSNVHKVKSQRQRIQSGHKAINPRRL